MQNSKIEYRRKAVPEGQGAGCAAGQLDFAASSGCGVSKLIRSRARPYSTTSHCHSPGVPGFQTQGFISALARYSVLSKV